MLYRNKKVKMVKTYFLRGRPKVMYELMSFFVIEDVGFVFWGDLNTKRILRAIKQNCMVME
jgi:hypothetical protein